MKKYLKKPVSLQSKFVGLSIALISILAFLTSKSPAIAALNDQIVPVLGIFGMNDPITIMDLNPYLKRKNSQVNEQEPRSIKIFPTKEINGMEYSPIYTLTADNHLLVLSHEPVEGDSKQSRGIWHSRTTQILYIVKQIVKSNKLLELSPNVINNRLMNAFKRQELNDITGDQWVSQSIITSSSLSSSVHNWEVVPNPEVIYTASSMNLMVVSVHDSLADILPSMLPSNTRVHRVDMNPKPGRADDSIPYTRPSITHLRNLYNQMNHSDWESDPNIVSLIQRVNQTQIKSIVQYLTGEDEFSPLKTRHSLSKGHRIAANWMKTKFKELGCHTVELIPFKELYGPNVVCTIPGSDEQLANEQVILSAHLDDRGSMFVPFTRAPGADDDASGSSMLVAVLTALHASKLSLRRTLKVIAFAGEEQGLVGSRAYARQARTNGDNIVWMLQADMIGYHKPGEPRQCALPAAHATQEANLIVSKIAQIYVPELKVGTTQACCSDHQSFYEQGFVSTQIFERNGPIADPYYHNSHDLSQREGYDFEQIQLLAQVALAATVSVAEINK